jgi:hypothetical protein
MRFCAPKCLSVEYLGNLGCHGYYYYLGWRFWRTHKNCYSLHTYSALLLHLSLSQLYYLLLCVSLYCPFSLSVYSPYFFVSLPSCLSVFLFLLLSLFSLTLYLFLPFHICYRTGQLQTFQCMLVHTFSFSEQLVLRSSTLICTVSCVLGNVSQYRTYLEE